MFHIPALAGFSLWVAPIKRYMLFQFGEGSRSRAPHQSIALRLTPLAGIKRQIEADRWRLVSLPARLSLLPEDGGFPAGWLLIQANLLAAGYDRTARLFADTGVPEAEMPVFDLPLSAKGILAELIELPPGTRRLLLQPMASLGEFHLADLSIRPASIFERFWHMLFRVLATVYMHPRPRLHRLGLHMTMLLFDLPRAYRLASLLLAQAPAPDYATWLAHHDVLTARDLQRIARDARRLRDELRFEVCVLTGAAADDLAFQATSASLVAQLFPSARIKRVAYEFDVVALIRADDDPRQLWFFILPEGATLSPHALYWFAHEISRHPEAGWVYCDHDTVSDCGERIEPAFKPDWSPELLRSTNYIGPAAAVRADVWQSAGGTATSAHDLWLRVSEHLRGDQIRHICAPLLHLPRKLDQRLVAADPPAVARHLARAGVPAQVETDAWGHCRVRFALLDTQPNTQPKNARPLISIIVPTRDRLDHLRPCIESVLEKTRYHDFELLVVDNQSTEPDALAYLEDIATRESVRVLRYPHAFNFSAINNFAAAEARGEYLCLLNNDTAVISPDWLEEMLGRLLQPDVGAVGAKLLFADGRVQHGGDTVGPGGCANHLHHLLPGDAPGYMHRAVLAQDLSAVTGACLLTRRSLYLSLGGLNERDLAVAFNDVDYCLRLREAGWRVVWTPYAELYHYESVSRGRDVTPAKRARADREVAYMTSRWGHVMRHDPFYNPNLSYARPDFSLSHAPLLQRPWEKSA